MGTKTFIYVICCMWLVVFSSEAPTLFEGCDPDLQVLVKTLVKVWAGWFYSAHNYV